MLKVLIIENSSYVTGAAKSIARFAKALSTEFEFQWAVTQKFPDAELNELIGKAQCYRFNFVEISKKPWRLLIYLPKLIANAIRLNRIVKDQKISIIHVNDLYNMTGAVVGLLNRKVTIVYHVRLLRDSYVGPLYSFFLALIDRSADAIVCCSKAVARDVGDRRVQTVVIYDSEEFSSSDCELPDLNQELKKIAYLGNILPGKGHDLAIRTIELLRDGGLSLSVEFIGKVDDSEISRNYKERLDRMISDAGLDEVIKFTGFRSDVANAIRQADLVLNLSESESFSMVCIEALKAGVPIVVSDCGGPSEIVEHMTSGWLVPNRDFRAAADAVETLSKDLLLRKRFSLEGKKRVLEKFNVSKNAVELGDLYQEISR